MKLYFSIFSSLCSNLGYAAVIIVNEIITHEIQLELNNKDFNNELN